MTALLQRVICAAGLILALGAPVTAQSRASDPPDAAMLVADDVFMTGDNTLVAEGNVEALYDGRRLQARKIIYDRETDSLSITGPITLTGEDEPIVLADSAELDRDLRNGLLRGARIVMEGQLQLAAHEMTRVDGRYSQLSQTAVTACRVCETGRPPLWQIRASQVIHDQQARQIYFKDAQFRVLNTPVLYLPRLRLPDPTVKRASGFLIPSVHNSSLLGTGVKVPYFIRLGDHADLTLTPFLAANTKTLEFRYRQAFRRGEIKFEGAISDDDLGERSTRAYLFGEGRFDLRNDFELTFNLEAVNAETYLLDYSYSDKDRLKSQLAIARARRDEFIRGAVTHFHSLRPGESNSTLPSIVGDAEYERRLFPERLGGEIRLSGAAHSHFRTSDLTTDGPDADDYADGRDMTRLTVSADWIRSWTLPGGIRARVQTGLAADAFRISQAGITSDSEASQLTPSAALRLRWPLQKVTAGGTSHVIEPVAQLAWVGGSTPDIPNDESTHIEFDEGNLLSLSRFSAPDRRERGTSLAYGVSWARHNPGGWNSRLTVGQVIRDSVLTDPDGDSSFSNSSGLQDRRSDLLIAGQFQTRNGLALAARGLFNSDFITTKAEARAAWRNDVADIGASYIWLRRDMAENRPDTISEWGIDGSYRLSRHWTGSARWRYDVARDQNVAAGIGVTYENECIQARLSASRRFTSSAILEPSTDISFTIALKGFSMTTQDESYTRTCRNQAE